MVQKNSRPNHPTTCGKVERFQQTTSYNHRRPHRSLPHRSTPATAYTTRPKATPTSNRAADTHDRIRHDIIDNAGSVTLRHNGHLHHIGIGRTHARTCVILLVQDLQIRVVNAIAGELLRELVLDPTRTISPPERPKDPPDHETPEPEGSRVSDHLRDHIGGRSRDRTCDHLLVREVLYR